MIKYLVSLRKFGYSEESLQKDEIENLEKNWNHNQIIPIKYLWRCLIN